MKYLCSYPDFISFFTISAHVREVLAFDVLNPIHFRLVKS